MVPALLVTESTTGERSLETGMPFASSMVTWGWGERAMPPELPPGSTVNARLAAAPDTTADGAMG